MSIIKVNASSIYVKEGAKFKDITEFSGIHSMVIASLPYVEIALSMSELPYKIHVSAETMFAMNKVCFDKYNVDGINVYFSDDKTAMPMVRFVDVSLTPEILEIEAAKKGGSNALKVLR